MTERDEGRVRETSCRRCLRVDVFSSRHREKRRTKEHAIADAVAADARAEQRGERGAVDLDVIYAFCGVHGCLGRPCSAAKTNNVWGCLRDGGRS